MDIISKASLAKKRAPARFKPGVNLADHIRIVEEGQNRTVAEFIGTGDFADAFYERQRYEVDAGRDEEPLLYQPIYSEISDPTLPRNVPVNKLGPAGVIFEEVLEGGEVKFATVGESSYSIPIQHYAVGLEYNKDLVIYNEQWRLGIVERQAGIAYNALLNHLHFNPILAASYAAANQTAAASGGGTLAENYVLTLEDAISASKADTTHPRRGPYVLLIAGADQFKVERGIQRRLQDGINVQSSALGLVRQIIAYDGWTGTRGKKSVTYAGVTAGKAYLVSLQYRDADFQSYEKQGLQSTTGNPDVTRFILEQTVWDFYRGLYSNPLAAVEEITWPTSGT